MLKNYIYIQYNYYRVQSELRQFKRKRINTTIVFNNIIFNL